MNNMNCTYQHAESNIRGYKGIAFEKNETYELLQNNVKNRLMDCPQRNEMLSILESLEQDTGFKRSEKLLLDIKALYNQNIDVQDFRIGEALAEIVLEETFSCRFYWNELRDARNPKGNKTGADLVGFIEIDNEILFLFGEIKTSSEKKSPPQVMTNPTGIENQLKNLYQDQQKRLILISYIQNKINLVINTNFKQDFDSAIKSYYRQDGTNYLLYGVLVRDTENNENDIKISFDRLNQEILEPIGLKFLAIYLPVSKEQWLSIINGDINESN